MKHGDSIAIIAVIDSGVEPVRALTVRNLDEAVQLALRRRAAEQGHSLEEEIRRTLRESVESEPLPRTGAELVERIRGIVEPAGGIELSIRPRRPARRPPALQ
ncbi:MAG: plasmid stabilization protein [Devosia sp.]